MDAFGAVDTDSITIDVVNRPPAPEIVEPSSGDTFLDHLPVYFGAYVPDPDELIPDEQVSWSSNLDGPLGRSSPEAQG